MEEAAIRILGAYEVEMTDALPKQAMAEKLGGIKLSWRARREAQRHVREELSSVALFEVVVKNHDVRLDVGRFTQSGT